MAGQVLCMIAEYHLACAIAGPSLTSPILAEKIEENLPPLADYAFPDGSGITDVRVREHKAKSLHVAVCQKMSELARLALCNLWF